MPIQGQAVRVASDDDPSWPVEIAFLERHGVSPDVLDRVAAIARTTAASPDQVMIRGDWLAEDVFYRALASELGLPFLDRRLSLGPGTRFPQSARDGVAPLAPAPGRPRLVLAPFREALAWLLAPPRPRLPPGLAITTPSRLSEAVLRRRAGEVIRHAANGLAEASPRRSCLSGCTLQQTVLAAACIGVLGASAVIEPDATATALVGLSAMLFFTMVILRLAASREFTPVRSHPLPARMNDRDLPIYTIIAPLYRERRVFERLIQGLAALDYPGLM